VAALLAAVLGFVGFKYYRANPTQNSWYSTDLNELRAQFNWDKGNVRLLMTPRTDLKGCLRGTSEVQAKRTRSNEPRPAAVFRWGSDTTT
jgi:hypothetical protein